MFKKFLVICFILLVSSNVWAYSVAVGDKVKFIDYPNTPDIPYAMYDSTTKTTYTTFCLESQKDAYYNTVYTVASVGNNAVGGGGGATVEYISGKRTTYDPVSDDTKWLYAAYMSGVFSNVYGAANRVQSAIWYLEGELGGKSSDWDFLNDFSYIATGWTVFAVNLTNNCNADIQSQLAGDYTAPVPVAPVPEPATMFLLGSGLLGLVGIRRKKK